MDKIINEFPGYEFIYDHDTKKPRNMYRGIDLGFGGYVYAEPGVHGNVALLDVQSMHPASIRAMNCFGDYTKNFTDILDARIAIKHGDYDTARQMMDGRLAPYLEDKSTAKDLAQALKIAINSVYGLTAANFDNPFRDNRNKNNIVALRGALFMKTLQDEVQAKGYTVCHIKTDSIKIADADKSIIDFCMEFGKKYGYIFEHEATYDKMCLVNDAVYIAKYKDGGWTATGTQFQVPYVFKTLFSKEPILFEDLCEAKSVTSALYLDMNENLPDVSEWETLRDIRMSGKSKGEMAKKDLRLLEQYYDISDEELEARIAKGHNYKFVGKVGNFTPVMPGACGGLLCREGKDKNGNTKYYSATGAKGHRWLESEMVYSLRELREKIDYSYFNKLVDDAVEAIAQYEDVEWFISDEKYIGSEREFNNISPF